MYKEEKERNGQVGGLTVKERETIGMTLEEEWRENVNKEEEKIEHEDNMVEEIVDDWWGQDGGTI